MIQQQPAHEIEIDQKQQQRDDVGLAHAPGICLHPHIVIDGEDQEEYAQRAAYRMPGGPGSLQQQSEDSREDHGIQEIIQPLVAGNGIAPELAQKPSGPGKILPEHQDERMRVPG